jgi:hypothetical protein
VQHFIGRRQLLPQLPAAGQCHRQRAFFRFLKLHFAGSRHLSLSPDSLKRYFDSDVNQIVPLLALPGCLLSAGCL